MSLNRLLRGFKRLQQSPQKLTKRRTKRETSLHRTWLKFKKISSPPGLLLISLLVLSFSNEQSIKFSLLFTYSRKWRFIFVRNDLASAKKTHETYEEMCSSYERRLDNNKQEFLLLQARTNKSCKNGECNQSQFWKKKKKKPVFLNSLTCLPGEKGQSWKCWSNTSSQDSRPGYESSWRTRHTQATTWRENSYDVATWWTGWSRKKDTDALMKFWTPRFCAKSKDFEFRNTAKILFYWVGGVEETTPERRRKFSAFEEAEWRVCHWRWRSGWQNKGLVSQEKVLHFDDTLQWRWNLSEKSRSQIFLC